MPFFFLPSKVIPCQALCNRIHHFDQNNDILEIVSQSTVCLEADIIICPTKWKLLSIFLNNYCEKLDIRNLNQSTIIKDYSLLANTKLRYLRLEFINDLNGLDSTAVNNLFLFITQSTNLKGLYLKFNTTKQQKFMKGTIDFNFTDGSLSKLQHLSIIDESNILNPDFLKLIEKAIIHPTNERGNLIDFTVKLILNEQVFPSITNILNFNRDTLQFFNISFQGRNSFNRNSSINLLQNSLVQMTKLIWIWLRVGLNKEEEEEEEENSQPEMQNNTKIIQPTLETEINNTTIKSCSQKRFWLSSISVFYFEGSLSLTSAIDVGVALGNSHKLTILQLISDITTIRIIAAYSLNFSKSIKGMQLTIFKDHKKVSGYDCAVKKNNTLESFSLSMDYFSLKSFFESCSIIENMPNLKTLTILTFQLKLDSPKDNSQSSLKELFINISKILSLESIDISICFEMQFQREFVINPRDIYLSLKNHPSLRRIQLYFSSNVNQIQFYKELALGLICYTRAKIILNGLEEPEQIIYGYELNQIILTLTILQFHKVIAPFLDFHPRRHLEDLYF